MGNEKIARITSLNYKIRIASDDEYEDLIVDVFYEHQLVVRISQEEGYKNLKISIYPSSTKEKWELNFDEFLNVILYAKKRLWDLRRIENGK